MSSCCCFTCYFSFIKYEHHVLGVFYVFSLSFIKYEHLGFFRADVEVVHGSETSSASFSKFKYM